MEQPEAAGDVRLAVEPGRGRLARRGRSLLFVPQPDSLDRRSGVDDLFERFHRVGPTAAADTDVPRCVVDWSEATGLIVFDSNIDLRLYAGDGEERQLVSLERWLSGPRHRGDDGLIVCSGVDFDPLATTTDLRDGDVHADAFGLIFPAAPSSIYWTNQATHPADDAAVEPPQFEDLADLDVTLAPVGPVTYPDDDTDRTFKRPGDIRCPRGHANSNTNHVCRVCAEPLDSTTDRAGPRASTAAAGLRLPDGSVIPINCSIVIGRSPTSVAARLEGTPRLVSIEAPGTVSRTHVVLHLDGADITVTDCDARGRTAIVRAARLSPIALRPWEPRALSIGDTIKLGGPTTLTITDPDEFRVPPSLEPTASPPERDETT